MFKMTAKPLTLAFVMDPIDVIDIAGDTTFVLMLEAQRRGHEIFHVDPAHLGVTTRGVTALVTPVELRREVGNHATLGTPRRVLLDAEIDVAFQRVDPPVDTDYILATQILGTCRRTLTLNHPRGVLAFNEKLFALHFADLMAETIVTSEIADLRAFMDTLGGEMIVKPLDGKGGEGIFHLVVGDRNMSSILEQVTQFESRLVMAQRYLPEIRQGDKRILLLEGEFLGAVSRVPAEFEVRANLHVGGTPVKAGLSATDRNIIERVGPVLRDEGLFFVGIDVIGDRLTEINVTSPTGIQEVNTLDGVRLEERVIERVEAITKSLPPRPPS
jgi:glutathione synthase